MSTIPAIGTCIMGMLSGNLILGRTSQKRKLTWLFIIGIISCFLGYIWSLDFPVNKNLWTSSYVLLTGGLAMVLLAMLIYLADELQCKKLTFIGIVFGMNAIAVYVLSDILAVVFYSLPIANAGLNEHFMNLADHSFFTHKSLSLLYAMMFVAINFIPAYWLYRRRIYIKL